MVEVLGGLDDSKAALMPEVEMSDLKRKKKETRFDEGNDDIAFAEPQGDFIQKKSSEFRLAKLKSDGKTGKSGYGLDF